MELQRTTATDPAFVELVRLLDAELAEVDGEEHSFYAQFNGLDGLQQVVVIYQHGQPVACGAGKPFGEEAVEIKRMYTRPTHRGQGLARQVLAALETWAAEEGKKRCVLETGQRQAEAVRLYQRAGYQRTANYGQYAGVENSLCFAKKLG